MLEEKEEILVDIQNLKLIYESQGESIQALDNINLEIKRGEFICILGPSGCGKSSLLKTIAGFERPSNGRCLMQGKEVEGPDWHRGVVFQAPTLYPWLNVKDNVEFGPKMRKVPKEEIEEISSHFLEQVRLKGFEKKSVFELSGGMKQRVALARVLANYPQMILMDEPFGALDALTRNNMQNLVRDIWKKNNSTIFFITHDIDEALALGTRIIVMSKRPGTIIKEFNVNFTHTIFDMNSNHMIYNEEYFNIKNEILDLINIEIE
jgi:taurine transport system ATP-binding protein